MPKAHTPRAHAPKPEYGHWYKQVGEAIDKAWDARIEKIEELADAIKKHEDPKTRKITLELLAELLDINVDAKLSWTKYKPVFEKIVKIQDRVQNEKFDHDFVFNLALNAKQCARLRDE